MLTNKMYVVSRVYLTGGHTPEVYTQTKFSYILRKAMVGAAEGASAPATLTCVSCSGAELTRIWPASRPANVSIYLYTRTIFSSFV